MSSFNIFVSDEIFILDRALIDLQYTRSRILAQSAILGNRCVRYAVSVQRRN